ncbi:MAG TPA: radical SAM protein [Planctomycetota bacterium]|nr:radical SAM protein [Planctomycetota bacterium]
MRYEGDIYRPPSEAESYILQATIGCSWNHCTYCDMYRRKQFRVRPLEETLEDVTEAGRLYGEQVDKVFVADGDALVLDLATWRAVLDACRASFPRLRRVSAYATARNLLEKTPEELRTLRELGLGLLYIGPESGDDLVLKRIAKGATAKEHVEAARKAHEAGMKLSVIFLLGAGGVDRSAEHARASAELATAMDPRFVSLLTLTVIPGTPLGRQEERGEFKVPEIPELLRELRTFIAEASPRDAIFRTNHASNWLALQGRLPRDRKTILEAIDGALDGRVPLRPDWARGL